MPERKDKCGVAHRTEVQFPALFPTPGMILSNSAVTQRRVLPCLGRTQQHPHDCLRDTVKVKF